METTGGLGGVSVGDRLIVRQGENAWHIHVERPGTDARSRPVELHLGKYQLMNLVTLLRVVTGLRLREGVTGDREFEFVKCPGVGPLPVQAGDKVIFTRDFDAWDVGIQSPVAKDRGGIRFLLGDRQRFMLVRLLEDVTGMTLDEYPIYSCGYVFRKE